MTNNNKYYYSFADADSSSLLEFVRDRLCNPDPSRRPASLMNDVVLSHPYFTDNDYVEVHAVLDNLPIRSEQEKT